MAKRKPVVARISLKALRPVVRGALAGVKARPIRQALKGRVQPKKPKGVRWGHVSEINYLLKIGSPEWRRQPKRLQHLHGWRADHAVTPSHLNVRAAARRQGVKPSSDTTINQKVAFFQKRVE